MVLSFKMMMTMMMIVDVDDDEIIWNVYHLHVFIAYLTDYGWHWFGCLRNSFRIDRNFKFSISIVCEIHSPLFNLQLIVNMSQKFNWIMSTYMVERHRYTYLCIDLFVFVQCSWKYILHHLNISPNLVFLYKQIKSINLQRLVRALNCNCMLVVVVSVVVAIVIIIIALLLL